MNRRRSIVSLAVVLTAMALSFACGGSSAPKSSLTPTQPLATSTPAATPTTVADGLKQVAESKYLSGMSQPLADEVRAQPWYADLTQAHLDLIAAIADCERNSQIRGEKQSVADILEFASEQPWYQDGLDDSEAAQLRGVFFAYSQSLKDDNAPQIGPVLSKTIQYQLEDVLQLPESGEMVLLVTADDPEVGRQALNIAADALPRVEHIVGKFPYSFLFISVTDLGDILAGESNDQFISIAPDAVDQATITHEITHSTLYGIFPTWFEEGFAYFMEYYLTSDLDAGVKYFTDGLSQLETSTKLYPALQSNNDLFYYLAQSGEGFLFLKGFYDITGIDAVTATIRSLRTKTFSSQDLLRTLLENSPPDKQKALSDFYCQDVRGSTHNYCSQ